MDKLEGIYATSTLSNGSGVLLPLLLGGDGVLYMSDIFALLYSRR